MSTIHFQILYLWRHTPGLYILLVTVPFLLFFFVMLKNIKNTNNTVVNVLMVCWFAVSAGEAYLLNAARAVPTKGRFWIYFVLILAVTGFCLSKMENFVSKAETGSRKRKLARALNHGNTEAVRRISSEDSEAAGALLEVNDPELIEKTVRSCYTSDNYPWGYWEKLAKVTSRQTAHELMNDRKCAMPFRLELYANYPEEADYSNVDWLIENATKASRETVRKFKDNLSRISDSAMLERALTVTNAYTDANAINNLLPALTYPEYAETLRKIVTSVRTLDLETRKKAYKKIPSSDMAFKKEYCPYCGSSDIKNGYMGLSMDLYWYGYRCTGCGHESRAPEGMGEAKPFTVKFSYFGHNNPPRS